MNDEQAPVVQPEEGVEDPASDADDEEYEEEEEEEALEPYEFDPTDTSWFTPLDPIEITLKDWEFVDGKKSWKERRVVALPVIIWRQPLGGDCGFGLMLKPLTEVEYESEVFHCRIGRFACTLIGPVDFISFWRGAMLLRECESVDPWQAQSVIFDAMRRPLEEMTNYDRESLLEAVRGGRETVERIKALPPPDWLIERILQEWSKPLARTAPWTLTREVRAGTLPWAEAFRTVGALTPLEEELEARLKELAEAQVKPVLKSAERAIKGHTPISLGDKLLQLAKAGALAREDRYTVAALALAASFKSHARIVLEVTVTMGDNPWAYARYRDRQQAWALKQLAPWVAKRQRTGKPFDLEQVTRTHARLVELMDRYFPGNSTFKELEDALRHTDT